MVSKPPFLPVLAILLGLTIAAAALIDPTPAPIRLLPSPALAVIQLRDAEYLVRFDQCAHAALQQWQEIARSANPGQWFHDILAHSPSPAGRAYALAGLRAISQASFDSAIEEFRLSTSTDTVSVLDGGMDIRTVPFHALIPELRSGAFTQIYSDTTSRPHCD